ncbi:phenylalanine--tRNA ligase subunit beta [Candidatus Woesearchaeota archaeon]|nr:phenylalanine--tRNA ligase subunit beta [Candidatus Woesearchaeota archaeon]
MPTVVLNKEVFEKLVGKKLPLDILKDRISMLGTDLEKIEGNEIHVEVFPNRPDMLSEQGFARALSSFIGVKTGLKEYKIKKSGYKVLIDSSVTMRPYTMCAIVKNLTFTDEKIREIMQIQEKLATTHGRNRKKSAYGIYPADKINFPIKYTAKNPEEVLFKPLGFTKQIKASQVAEEHPKGIAYKHLTEGWKEYPFFIDAKLQIMCMLPFTNSEETGKIELNTKDVFIECTGVDLENVTIALNIIVTMLADMGGEVYSMDMVYSNKTITSPELSPKKMKLKLEYVNKRLGLNLKEGDVKKLLERMGYDYDKGIVSIPAYRADILHMIDIVEDIAIAYGYENFSEEIPNVSTIAQEDEFKIFERRISNILCGLGLIETCNYHLINYDEQTKKMNLNEKAMDSVNVKLANPTTAEYNALRSWMIPCLMNVFKSNKHNEYPQKIFDTGIVFRKNKNTETNVEEITTLAVGSSHATTDFTEIKQILDYLLNMLNIEYKIIEHEHPSFITGRIGEIIIRDKKMGVIGEISPQVLENFGLETPVSAFELDLNELFNVMRH